MAQLSFDATTVQPQAAFEVLKPGWYTGQITASDLMQTRNQDGHYLKLEFTILADANGESSVNRKVWTNLNIDNQNEVAVKIAQEQLSAICHAIGRLQVQDSAELHAQPMMIRLKVRAASDNYDANNEISAFKALEGGGAAGTTAAGVQPPSAVAPPIVPPAVQQPAAVPPPTAAVPGAVAPPVAPAPGSVPAPGAVVPPPVAPAAGVPNWAQGGTPPG